MVGKLFKVLLNWIYPRGEMCLLCARPYPGDSYICEKCSIRFVYLDNACPLCALPHAAGQCANKDWPIAGAAAPFVYEGAMRDLIHRLKYNNMRDAAHALAFYMKRCIPLNWPEDALLVPVPMHPRKMRIRGYNQADDIARALSEMTGRKVLPALKRIVDTPSQTKLTKAKRKRNLADAFAVNDHKNLSGRTVILIDDVMTTAETAINCAHTLICGGAKRVYVLTAARAI